jgi:hypothetical protein
VSVLVIQTRLLIVLVMRYWMQYLEHRIRSRGQESRPIAGANRVALFGEINTTAKVDFEKIVRKTISSLGYINPEWGFLRSRAYSKTIFTNSHLKLLKERMMMMALETKG